MIVGGAEIVAVEDRPGIMVDATAAPTGRRGVGFAF